MKEQPTERTDIVKLAGLNPSDVTFIHVNNSNHLLIQINSTGEILTVQDQFNATNGIEQVLFGDGSTWDRSQIQAAGVVSRHGLRREHLWQRRAPTRSTARAAMTIWKVAAAATPISMLLAPATTDLMKGQPTEARTLSS